MEKINKKDKFISKAIKIHGDKFDYLDSNYINSETKIKIACNKHNILFEQVPSEHLRGKIGCDGCLGRITNTNVFITKAIETHSLKYTYIKSNYIASNIKVIITCPNHGDFEQLPINHINGQGCPTCGRLRSNTHDTKEDFIVKARLKHGDKYDYTSTEYINSNTSIRIICPKHGLFEQLPYSHVRGKGCLKCIDKEVLKMPILEFINRANKVHKDKFTYTNVVYDNAHTKVKINCPIHGQFEQRPDGHLQGVGCRKCGLSHEKAQNEIKGFIESLGVGLIENTRNVISPLELDIYVSSHKLAIEYNGLYWHSEKYKTKDYHLNKTLECERRGIQLIHIFEDEWLLKKDIVKSRLLNLLGLTPNKIYARKTKIQCVSTHEAKAFLELNHIQGNTNSPIRLGLYLENELVSLMTFGSLRKNLGATHKDGSYELIRFCNKLDTSVIGGADKLLKHFIKTYHPKEIISYADRRWSMGGLYEKLGFEHQHNSKPNYFYLIGLKRENRFKYRKDVLVKEGYDKDKTEYQIMLERGIYRIYDSGTQCFKLKLG